MPDEVTEPSAAVLFGYTDFELACLHVSLIVLLLVAGFLLGMPATTTRKAEFKATKAEHPAGWWPLVDAWCRSVEWAQRTLVYEIGPPLVKAKFVIDTMKGLTPLVLAALMVRHATLTLTLVLTCPGAARQPKPNPDSNPGPNPDPNLCPGAARQPNPNPKPNLPRCSTPT